MTVEYEEFDEEISDDVDPYPYEDAEQGWTSDWSMLF